MEQFYSMLLNVWHEACRHIELNESTPLITSLLQKDLALDQILVKRVFFKVADYGNSRNRISQERVGIHQAL